MKKLYLIGSIIVFLLIIILSLPQIGSICDWELISMNTNPTFVLFQAAGLGAVLGGLLVLYWKTPKKPSEGGMGEGEGEGESGSEV